jgi:hypothetical protein
MTTPGDLLPLLAPPPPGDRGPTRLGFRQGVVLSWDASTAANSIQVGGAVLTNVPIIDTFDALNLRAGDVIGLFTFGSSWFVLGRITVPGLGNSNPNAISDRTQSYTIETSEATATTSFIDLATPGPTVDVTVPASGARVLVMLTAQISGAAAFGGEMSFTVTGASSIGAASTRALAFQAAGAGKLGATFIARLTDLDGLVGGVNQFTAKYRAVSGTATFAQRNLTVATI